MSIKIVCTRPGLRRAGMAHDASRVWPASTFTREQIDLLRSDSAFVVEERPDQEAAPALALEEPGGAPGSEAEDVRAPAASKRGARKAPGA